MESPKLNNKQQLRKEDVLALDIASQTGFYSISESGAWNFYESKIRNNNKKHKAFRDTVMGFILKYDIKMIVAEGVNVGTHFAGIKGLSELHGILLEICDELDLPEPEYINPTTLKKWATGNGRATKLDMIRACEQKYKYRPKTDDEADAMHLFYYYLRKHRIE